jgi:hypothetical protein
MNESDYKTAIVKKAKKAGWYARRIEDKYGVGFPDMIIRPKRLPVCFIEAKIITGRQFSPSPRQYIELRDIDDTCSIAIVLGIEPFSDGAMYHFSLPVPVARIGECDYSLDFVSGLIRHIERRVRNEQ